MAKSVTVTGSSLDDTITTDWDFKWSTSKFAWRYWGEVKVKNDSGSSTKKTGKTTTGAIPDVDLFDGFNLYLDAAGGNDDIELEEYFTGYIDGGIGNDTIIGYHGEFNGEENDDYIKIKKEDGEKQRLEVSGGSGTDTLDLSSFNKSLSIDLGAATRLYLEGDREVLHDGTFENYIGTSGSEDITAVSGGSVISSGKGNDTLRGEDGHDYLDPGDVNTGDTDTVYTGRGWDVVYLGDIGSANQDYTQDPTELSIWATLGADPDGLQSAPDPTFWEEFLGNDDAVGASLKLVPVVGKYLSTGYDLVNFLIGTNDKSKAVDGGDASSFVKIMDFDARYDQVILPVTTFDVPTPDTDTIYEYLNISLDAENGGVFTQLYFDDTYLNDFAADVGITIGSNGKSREEVASSLWSNLWLSRTSFSYNDDNTVEAYQGSEQLNNVDDEVQSFLDKGEHMSIFGNVGGYYVSANYDDPYVTGSAQNDRIGFYNNNVSADNGPGAYMVASFEGEDYLQVTNATQNIVFNGGDGLDIISFADLKVSNSNAATYTGGVDFDLAVQTQTPASTGQITIYEVEGVEGTAYADRLTGSTHADMLLGNAGNDTLVGNSGADTLTGGTGNDMLTGGSGTDQFVFTSSAYWGTPTGNDTITDLESQEVLLITNLTSSSGISVTADSANDRTEVDIGGATIFIEDELLGKDDFEFTLTSDGMKMKWLGTSTGTTTDTGNNGDTVICTHMNAKGFIPDEVYRWDSYYGAEVLGATVVRGYHVWAIPLVEHVLKRSDLATRLLAPVAQAWAQEMAHRCDPVAHPQGSALGRAILVTGVPLCRALGHLLETLQTRSTAKA